MEPICPAEEIRAGLMWEEGNMFDQAEPDENVH
jgi:hypothetical protein